MKTARVFLGLILVFVAILVVVLIRSSFEEPKYAIDTTTKATMHASIIELLQEDFIQNEDHHKFYLLLVESEAGTEVDPETLLAKYGIPYVQTEGDTLGKATLTRLEYEDFRDGLYTGGFSLVQETKRLKITYVEVQEVFVEEGETFCLFGNSCPTGWTHVEDDVLSVTCQSEDTGIQPLALWEESEVRHFHTRYFERRLDRPQNLYGYEDTYNPYITFTYRSHIPAGFFGPFIQGFITPLATITLIDDDKLHIEWGEDETFVINRRFHHERNTFNIDFAPALDTLPASPSPAFFHQLGHHTGDESNFENVKFTLADRVLVDDLDIYDSFPHASSEAVYRLDGDIYQLIEDPLNMGSFNFADTAVLDILFNRERIVLHYIYDVYPYLLFGNAPGDCSSVQERFIWDRASLSVPSRSHLRAYRGEDLYHHDDADYSPHLVKEGVSQEDLLALLKARLRD